MEIGLIHRTDRLPAVCYKLKRQIVLEFQSDIDRATGWRRDWLRWKRAITLAMRYNQILFLKQTGLRGGEDSAMVIMTRLGGQPWPTKKTVAFPS